MYSFAPYQPNEALIELMKLEDCDIDQFGEQAGKESPQDKNLLLIYLAENTSKSIPKRIDLIEILLTDSDIDHNFVTAKTANNGEKKYVSALYIFVKEGNTTLINKLFRHKKVKLVEEVKEEKSRKTPENKPILQNIQQIPNLLETAIFFKRPAAAKLLIEQDPRILDLYQGCLLKDIFDNAEIIVNTDASGKQENSEPRYAKNWKNLIQTIVTVLSLTESTPNFHSILDYFCQSFFSNFKFEDRKLKVILPMKTLINCDKFNINGLFNNGEYTLMMMAANHDMTDLMEILKDKKADLNAKNKSNKMATHYLKSAEAAKIIMTAENIDCQDNDSNSPLKTALEGGDLDLVMFFVENGAKLNFGSQNILHFLPSHDYYKIRTKLKKKGVTYRDFLKQALEKIFEKISASNESIRSFLVQARFADYTCFTPLEQAFEDNNYFLFEIFLEKENEEGITTLADKDFIENVIKSASEQKRSSFVVAILNQLSSQKKDSKNLVSMEILLKLKKQGYFYDNSYFLHLGEKENYLKLLDTVIEKFQEPPEELKKLPEYLTNNNDQKQADIKEALSNHILTEENKLENIVIQSPQNGENEAQNNLSTDDNNIQEEAKNESELINNSAPQVDSYPTPTASSSPAQVAQNASETAATNYFSRFVAWVRGLWHRVRDFFTGNVNLPQENKTNPTQINAEIVADKPKAPPYIGNQQRKQNELPHDRNF